MIISKKNVKVVGEVWEAQNAITSIALYFQTVLQLHCIKFSPDYTTLMSLENRCDVRSAGPDLHVFYSDSRSETVETLETVETV